MQSFDTEIQQTIQNLQIKELNPMQLATIEASATNDHIVLLSNTGSGKTLAFLLPIWQKLQKDVKGVQAIVIVPSRELAIQIDDVLRKIGTGFKVTLCYGGHKREIEENNLIEAPSIIIGTPGRLADHIRRHNFDPRSIHTLVIDEFDKSLELGFVDEMQMIIESMPSLQSKILTSATEAVDIPSFIKLKDEVRLDFIDKSEKNEEQLSHYTVLSDEKDKVDTLFNLLCQVGSRPTIIFCNHRDAVERVNTLLLEKGIYSVFYHGGMEQYERDTAMCKFRNGTSLILVTTDLASRGLDIAHIRNIIHYHLPMSEEVFTHRNGRTARMDRSGNVYVIYSSEEDLPNYITEVSTDYVSNRENTLPEKPSWSTLYIAHGKKDKINKIDIVGFLSNIGQLKKEDIGLIDVKDFSSFVAIRKSKMNSLLELIKDQKIKNKKAKMYIAK